MSELIDNKQSSCAFITNLVSVIMPSYNTEEFIDEAIDSIIRQSYKNWELIVVDDHSTDNTYEIARDYTKKDSRIKVLQNDRNMGVAATRNIALTHASGEYIAFLDSDDIWMPEKLENQLSFMKNNNYALTYTNYQKFNKTKISGKTIYMPPIMTYESILYNTAIGCLTVMINRKLVGDFRMPSVEYAEDTMTWAYILHKGYTAYRLNKTLALYRTRSQSLTSNKLILLKRKWNMYRKYYKFSFYKSLIYFSANVLNAIKKNILI